MTDRASDRGSGSVEQILEALQERAKELHCLYRVHEITDQRDAPLEEIFREVVEVIPAGWQYPDACWTRITFGDRVFQPTGAEESPWVLRAVITVQGEPAGRLEVFYTEQMPDAGEGPFLKEERKLIDTIAERLAHAISQRRLQRMLSDWRDAMHDLSGEQRREWWVIVDFLRKTDRQLLQRLSRRLLNYLAWNGIAEAQALLQRQATGQAPEEPPRGENQPLRRRTPDELLALSDATFRIAAGHLPEQEILTLLQRWIKDDKSAFLVEAVEDQATSLHDIGQALERFHHSAIDEHELSRAIQIGLRVALIRRFFTDDHRFINAAKNYVGVGDFFDLARRVISPARGHGQLGGKSAGLFLAAHIATGSTEYADALGPVRVPRTWYMASDALVEFLNHNQLQEVHNRKYLEPDQIRREYPHLVQVFKNSKFTPELVNGLSLALDDLHDRPLIVRSSSLLEDRMGAAFSGKYKSLFLANQGTKAERLAALMDAVAEVYASAIGPDPLEYRAERGLLDLHEAMGIMIQEVVGRRCGRYFFPAVAGVALSHNEFRWSPRIRREDGLLRLVPGLGTRAVDRLVDDYPVLVAPGQPGLRANVSPDEVLRYAPKRMDVINLETRQFETVEVAALLDELGGEFPEAPHIFSICTREAVRPASKYEMASERANLVVTFDSLVQRTPFVTRMRTLLRLLREQMGTPVDLEFALDGGELYLLQCRPQSASDATAPVPVPQDVPRDLIVFSANRYVSNGRVPDLTHLVFVDPEAYQNLPDAGAMSRVGQAIGRLNKLLPKRQFALIGPGRWGSRGDIRLGVPVTYSDINNTAVLIEMAKKRGHYVPDLSFGTHFFQDLVEAEIRYLPLYPDEPDIIVNERFLHAEPNLLRDLVPEMADLAPVVRVIDVPRVAAGRILRVVMNADLEQALGYLAEPAALAAPASAATARPAGSRDDDHWRWRLRMAERIAGELDPARFGVRAVYLFGSTKNATAGAGSDIDLIVHVDDREEHHALEAWLDGWSVCLAEVNFLRTGYRAPGLLDVHYVTDRDLERRTSYAVKIGAVTDAARPLPLGVMRAPDGD